MQSSTKLKKGKKNNGKDKNRQEEASTYKKGQ